MEEEKIAGKKYTPKVQMLKDALYLNDRVPVRVKRRLEELKKKSQAFHKKEQVGQAKRWHTMGPEMHISNLQASVVNGIGTISYDKYKLDKDGNKEKKEIVQVMPTTGNKIVTSCDYILEKQIVETIEFKKPLNIEEFMY